MDTTNGTTTFPSVS